jgi:hypothetical protein
MILHGYDLDEISRLRESFQQLHRKSDGKLGLRATSVPYWRDEAAVILDDGAFQRAMRLVPHEEAQALWADFDAQMERLYAIWAAACASPSEAAPAP